MNGTVARLRQRAQKAMVGRDDVIDLLIIAIVVDGHVLLEDYPGSGKTTLAKALGTGILATGVVADQQDTIKNYKRVQFTPDLLPGDITGVNVFDVKSSTFRFTPGPVFSRMMLADEINRTSPKVQAALLEAMAEKQVTVEGITHPLDELFCVIATQNPRDTAGTYPLPTPQLDRFLFKIIMKPLSHKDELQVLATYPLEHSKLAEETETVSRDEVLAVRAQAKGVHIHPEIKDALIKLKAQLADDARIQFGLSTRALLFAMKGMQGAALLQGRDFVSPQDLADLAPYLFLHRLVAWTTDEEAEQALKEAVGKSMDQLARIKI